MTSVCSSSWLLDTALYTGVGKCSGSRNHPKFAFLEVVPPLCDTVGQVDGLETLTELLLTACLVSLYPSWKFCVCRIGDNLYKSHLDP